MATRRSHRVLRQGVTQGGAILSTDGPGWRAHVKRLGFSVALLLAVSAPLLHFEFSPFPSGTPALAAGQPPSRVHSPASSRITRVFETKADEGLRQTGSAPQVHFGGYQRADILGSIYEDRHELVNAAGLANIKYFLQSIGALEEQCPNLNLLSATFALLPYLMTAIDDLTQRIMSGRASDAEIIEVVWGTLFALNQNWSCTYNPGSGRSRASAQASCNAAAEASSAAAIPSFDAVHDMTLWIGRQGCDSRETRHLVRGLVEYMKDSRHRLQFSGEMPHPDSPEGQAYRGIFTNCTRQAIGNRADRWCGCYLRTLNDLDPTPQLLKDLAANPFVDAASYMLGTAQSLKGAVSLYDCTKLTRGSLGWSNDFAPRPTACLIEEKPAAGGERDCHYRAAWGEFSLRADECSAEISSKRWGYREVDCGSAGAVATPSASPRLWKGGVFTMVDYEQEVAPGFVPLLPEGAHNMLPLQVRLTQRKTKGLLKSMSLTVPTPASFGINMGRISRETYNIFSQDASAIYQEGQLVLECTYYLTEGTQRSEVYWYEQMPGHIAAGKLNPATREYFERIGGPAVTCPARVTAR